MSDAFDSGGSLAATWLLDFDGVLNAVVRRGSRPDRSVWPDWTAITIEDSHGTRYPVTYSPTVVRFISRVSEAGVNVVWVSDWQADAERFCEAIPELPTLPWVAGELPLDGESPPPPTKSPGGLKSIMTSGVSLSREPEAWWKAVVVPRYVESLDGQGSPFVRPLIWTDDELSQHAGRGARAWVNARANSLVVDTQPHLGLTPRGLRTIRDFLMATAAISIPGD